MREKESAACPLNEVRNHSFNYERHSNGATAAAPSTDNSWRKSMKEKERERKIETGREIERETCRKCTRSAFNEFGDFSSHKFLRDGGLGTARAATRPARSDLRRRVTGC